MRIVYAQRQTTAAAYDTALLADLALRGHEVTVELDSLAAYDWANYDLLIVGANGTNYVAHQDAASLDGYAVDILSFCRHTSRNALAMASSSGATAVSYLARIHGTYLPIPPEGLDPRVQDVASVTLPSVDCHLIYGLASGVTPLYYCYLPYPNDRYGVCEKFTNGYSRVHFGRHDLDNGNADLLTIFRKFTGHWPAIEQADSAALVAEYMPAGGFTVAGAAIEQGDSAAFSALFQRLYDASLNSTEGGDSFAAVAAFDWTAAIDPLTTQTYWAMDVYDDSVSYRMPISSWQATIKLDRASYVQCVVPAAGQWLAPIAAMTSPTIRISQGARFENGLTHEIIFATAPLEVSRYDEGPTNQTLTLSGYATLYTDADIPTDVIAARRQLTGIRSVSSGSAWRVRCAVDWYLQPGAVAVIDPSREFTADWINYYVNTLDQYMEVGDGDG